MQLLKHSTCMQEEISQELLTGVPHRLVQMEGLLASSACGWLDLSGCVSAESSKNRFLAAACVGIAGASDEASGLLSSPMALSAASAVLLQIKPVRQVPNFWSLMSSISMISSR